MITPKSNLFILVINIKFATRLKGFRKNLEKALWVDIGKSGESG